MSTAYNFVNQFLQIDTYENGERDWDGLRELLVRAAFMATAYEMTEDAMRFKFSDGSELAVNNPHQHDGFAMATAYEDDEYVISYY